MIDPNNPIFQNDESAREFLEAQRWPHGPVCPHCEAENAATKMQGKSTRPGLYKCRRCEKPYTVTVGTVFERSKVPLHTWMYATFLMCASKKGMSAKQLERMIGVQYKTAWFMFHRIREAMRKGDLAGPMGGGGGIVEVDETFMLVKRTRGGRGRRLGETRVVLTLIDRTGESRSFHIDRANGTNIVPIVRENISREATLSTDDAPYYSYLDSGFAGRGVVKHRQEEYVRGEFHTNSCEGYFSIFKRGMRGVYQHCGEQHLHRYLAEFDFRYSNRIALGIDDDARAAKALKGISGKRLLYKKSGAQA